MDSIIKCKEALIHLKLALEKAKPVFDVLQSDYTWKERKHAMSCVVDEHMMLSKCEKAVSIFTLTRNFCPSYDFSSLNEDERLDFVAFLSNITEEDVSSMEMLVLKTLLSEKAVEGEIKN